MSVKKSRNVYSFNYKKHIKLINLLLPFGNVEITFAILSHLSKTSVTSFLLLSSSTSLVYGRNLLT